MTDDHRAARDPAGKASGPTTFAEARQEARGRRRRGARRLQDDERFDGLRSIRARRALVLLGCALLVTSSTLLWWDLEWLAGTLGHVVFLAGMGVVFLLNRVLRRTDEAPDAALDERLVAARNAAARTAYRWVTSAMITVLFVVAVVVGDAAEQRHLQALFLGFALAAVLAPLAVRAWRESEV